MEEGIGHNAERSQELRQELAQWGASLQQELAEAQALQDKGALVANIIEKEMAHQTQVSLHLHLQQAKEIKSPSDEIRHLSTLLEKQQAILERVQEQQSRMPEIPIPQNPTPHIKELQREAFNILPGTVNARWGADLVHTSEISQDILVAGKANFENELAEEATWVLYSQPHHVHFASEPQGGFTSTLRKYPEQKRSHTRFNPATYPPRYEMKMVEQEFHRLHKPKINKLKDHYSAKANLIFQSWLKDIKMHIEDWNLTERETIQLVKDFTAERAHDEVEIYMGIIADDQQTFDGLVNHLKRAFHSGETLSELISNFYGW